MRTIAALRAFIFILISKSFIFRFHTGYPLAGAPLSLESLTIEISSL